MTQTFIGRKRVRKFFGHIAEVAEMPNLIEVQKEFYDQFLQMTEPVGGRANEGLQAVFKSVFPLAILPARPCWNSSVMSSSRQNMTWRNVSSGA